MVDTMNEGLRRNGKPPVMKRRPPGKSKVAMDWTAAANRARQHLGKRKRTFSETQSLELIDFFAEHGTVTSAQMQQHGSADFVGTILGHVTTAVHGGGRVPKAGGWYRTEAAGSIYVIDPGFAEAWKAG
ncbi:hypothetical protein [Methylobacterium sp. SyP6R]|uniref:hypothetical protein n=1 Tax=Methylobacterium sp. SyP6R TaxID=2718876 RepID=UPI001F4418C7|nr:hypothetical protein [Methylobacterium sp. SyP6R]MCF4123825.1 hypothetical protein [Methylobacterium sp. SyP6R]